MGILHQLASLVSSLPHSWREQVYHYLGATVIYLLINTAYENTLSVVATPAGFAHLPGSGHARLPRASRWDAVEQGRGEGIPAG